MNVHVARFVFKNLNRPIHIVILKRAERERERARACPEQAVARRRDSAFVRDLSVILNQPCSTSPTFASSHSTVTAPSSIGKQESFPLCAQFLQPMSSTFPMTNCCDFTQNSKPRRKPANILPTVTSCKMS